MRCTTPSHGASLVLTCLSLRSVFPMSASIVVHSVATHGTQWSCGVAVDAKMGSVALQSTYRMSDEKGPELVVRDTSCY